MSDTVTAGAALIWCPFPDDETAKLAIAALLDERLIACGNMLPAMHSLFAWQGKRHSAQECGVLLKTHGSRLDQAMARLATLHPYDAPAMAGWLAQVDKPTLAWLEQETRAA